MQCDDRCSLDCRQLIDAAQRTSEHRERRRGGGRGRGDWRSRGGVAPLVFARWAEVMTILWCRREELCAPLARLLRTARPITQGHTPKHTRTASRERGTFGQHCAVGHSGAFLTLRAPAWWERGAEDSMAAEFLSHLQPQHNSSITRQSLRMRAHRSTPVCMRCVHSHGLSLLRCLCALRGSLNL